MSSSIETLVNREYQHGFVTDIEADTIPPDLSEEAGARVAARVAAEGLSPLADDERAALAEREVRVPRLPGDLVLLGAEDGEAARQPGRARPEDPRDVRQARH